MNLLINFTSEKKANKLLFFSLRYNKKGAGVKKVTSLPLNFKKVIMNKVIFSSKFLLKKLSFLQHEDCDEFTMIANQKVGAISISVEGEDITLFCEPQNDFELTLYSKSIDALVKILSAIEEQPVTLQFNDSENFNINIIEMTV